MNKNFSLTAASLCAVFAAAGVAAARDKIPVVATFSILADITQRVGGDRIAVETLVGPEQDAHVFQPSPRAAATVATARLLVSNGLGFEGWIERLISSSGYKGPVTVASRGVTPLAADEARHGEAPLGGNHDPHAWQDMANALVYVENIKQGLCAIDASGCDTYAANAQTYAAEISALNARITSDIGALPGARRKVITSHDAFGYFARAYGVVFLAPTGISTESEASAKDVAKLIGQIRSEHITALFVENISDARLIEQIGRETGVKPGAVLYSDALSKAGGPAGTYLDMMRHNASALTQAMAGS